MQWIREKVMRFDNNNGSYELDIDMYLQAVEDNQNKYHSFDKYKMTTRMSDDTLFEYGDWKKRLESHMKEWKKFIYYNLPGDLKSIGMWVNQAETILDDLDIPHTMNEETASYISKKIEHHKKFFAAYPDVVDKFNSIKMSPSYTHVSPKIMNLIEEQLLSIEPRARQRRIKLKFMEHKCCLIAFLNLLENKISSVKYGNEDVVKQSLEQIRSFLIRNKIVEEFEKALVDMRQVIEEFKVDGGLNRNELQEIDQFIVETENRWKSVSTGLKCTETMLQETLNHWNRFNNTVNNLSEWISNAEVVLQLPEMEQMEFFQDIALVKKSYDSLHDDYNFLKATCDKDTVYNLDQVYANICQQWERIYQYAKQYTHAGDILKNRRVYEKGIQNLCNWLRNAENVLNVQNLNSADEIREHMEKLKQISCEMEDMEDTFRNVSKSFQNIISDISSRDEIDHIMKLLKKEKESLVCVRANVPMKIQLFHQLLSQQESIELGVQEISQWLDDAENLLSTYSLATRKSHTLQQLEKHKQFFTKTLYYKSMLENKNIILQNLLRATDVEKNIDIGTTKDKNQNLNERFNYVVSNAVQWERKLHEIIACWTSFEACEKVLADYLKKANTWLSQSFAEKKDDFDEQKDFFENINEQHVQNFFTSANELSQYLPNNGKQEINNIKEKLQLKWSNLIALIPLHILKINFYNENSKFSQMVRDIEKELNYEEQAFHRNESLDELLSQHLQFFEQSNIMSTTDSSLGNMQNILMRYNIDAPNDKELDISFQNKAIVWSNICKRIEIIFNDLQQIPNQWINYNEKFNKIEKWMDSVEVSLSHLMKEMNTLEEFESEKLVFQVNKITKSFINLNHKLFHF